MNGMGTATDVILSTVLDPNVIFQSVTSSLGSVTNLGSIILANIGTLTNGNSATLTIDVMLNAETNITDTAMRLNYRLRLLIKFPI